MHAEFECGPNWAVFLTLTELFLGIYRVHFYAFRSLLFFYSSFIITSSDSFFYLLNQRLIFSLTSSCVIFVFLFFYSIYSSLLHKRCQEEREGRLLGWSQ